MVKVKISSVKKGKVSPSKVVKAPKAKIVSAPKAKVVTAPKAKPTVKKKSAAPEKEEVCKSEVCSEVCSIEKPRRIQTAEGWKRSSMKAKENSKKVEGKAKLKTKKDAA
jgi:hypothetical protein